MNETSDDGQDGGWKDIQEGSGRRETERWRDAQDVGELCTITVEKKKKKKKKRSLIQYGERRRQERFGERVSADFGNEVLSKSLG